MNFTLSFCEIEQLSKDIYEVTINEGVIIDAKYAEEAQIFWHGLRNTPYALLVNNKNRYSYSFTGSQKIGDHVLERKTAILIDDHISKNQMLTVMELKKMAGNDANRKVFKDRNKALKWLETP